MSDEIVDYSEPGGGKEKGETNVKETCTKDLLIHLPEANSEDLDKCRED